MAAMKCPTCSRDVVDTYQLVGYVISLMGLALMFGWVVGSAVR